MGLTSLAVLLGKELGLPLARRIVSGLGVADRDATGRVGKVASLVNSGSSAVAAFQDAFGVDFDKAMNVAIGTDFNGWTHERGREDYVCLEQCAERLRPASSLLREELNINLDRIIRVYGRGRQADPDMEKYFLGLFRQWQERYVELIGNDDDSKQTFEAIDGLLDGKRKTFSDVFRMLQRTGLGMAGAALVIQAALIATSTGVGVFVWITTAMAGIPMVQVGALAAAGVALFGLSRMNFTASNSMSAVVAAAYKLLDRHAATPSKK